jgi:hypothetical protein
VVLIYYLTERPGRTSDSASLLWQTINPSGERILVRIPDALLILFPTLDIPDPFATHDPGWTLRLGPLLSLIKVAVLPQLVTAGLLYALLLYLLKDADLLDAQRNRLGREEEASDLGIMYLPAGESDIDLIRSSADGSIVVTISMGTATLWRFSGTREDVAEGVVDAVVSSDGLLLAVATDKTRVYRVADMTLVETLDQTGRLMFEALDPFRKPRLFVANAGGVYEGGLVTTEQATLIDGGFLTVGKTVKLWTDHTVELSSTPDKIQDTSRLDGIIAIAWRSGLIEIIDTSGTLLLSTRHTGVRTVILVAATARCSTCSSNLGGFYIISCSDTCNIQLASRSICRCRDNTTSPQRSPLLTPSDFPVSSHGTRRLSALHHPSELELSDIGCLPCVRGGAAVLDNTCIVLHRSGKGVGDHQFSATMVDLTSTSLVTKTVNLHDIVELPEAPIGIQQQRRERMLNKAGRRSFPSISAAGSSGMAYVSVSPITTAGNRILGGFGNRLGVITLKNPAKRKRTMSTIAVEVPPTPQQSARKVSGMLAVPDM